MGTRTHPRRLTLLSTALAGLLAAGASAQDAAKADLSLSSPRDYQVFQRRNVHEGAVTVAGSLSFQGAAPGGVVLECRLAGASAEGALPAAWQPLPFDARVLAFRATLPTPAGGWYQLDVRVRSGDAVLAEARVEHVGVGEVFVVAGQSNAANHGAKRTTTRTGKVTAFDGTAWRPADDPQPGASGQGGSFLPAFGDALVEKYKVPVGVSDVAVGATSVRQWLPRGERMERLPTLTGHVVTVGPDQWECTGELFDKLAARVRSFGPDGVRAVLWHQGESDANQASADRTLPGKQYRAHLEKVIRESRRQAGWDVPWFTAQASYHSPDDPGSPEIREAQKSLWADGLALEGPDTDALTGDDREAGGVHFSAKGLQAHGLLWADKVGAWLDKALGGP